MRVIALLPIKQREDANLARIINSINYESNASPAMIKEAMKYSLSDPQGALTVRFPDGRMRLAIPLELQVPIIELFHKSPALGGHAGHKATTLHIQRYFHWKHIAAQVKSYCKCCEACIRGKNQHGKIPGLLTLPQFPEGPFHRIHADTMRCLPPVMGYRHVLIIVDAYTKYIFTTPLRSGHPRLVVEALTQVFTRFGQPALFVADRGGEFYNKEVVAFLKMWGVQWHFTAAYNPQANGQAESSVKIIANKLRLTLLEAKAPNPITGETKPISWVNILPYVTMAYNRCPKEEIGFSPYELVFGRVPPLPVQVPEEVLTDEYPTHPNYMTYLANLQANLMEARGILDLRLEARRQRMKSSFDHRRSPLRIEKGEFAYIAYPFSKKIKKLEARAKGPYLVTQVTKHPETGDVVSIEVEVKDPNTGQSVIKRYPRRRIRPVRARLPLVDWNKIKKSPDENHIAWFITDGSENEQDDGNDLLRSMILTTEYEEEETSE